MLPGLPVDGVKSFHAGSPGAFEADQDLATAAGIEQIEQLLVVGHRNVGFREVADLPANQLAERLGHKAQFFEGRRRLLPVPGGPPIQTDDAGQYRLVGLTPGSYFVRAQTRETWTVTDGDIDVVMGYVPTFYPGTTTAANARRVPLAVGQEATNIDLALVPGRAITLSGSAFRAASSLGINLVFIDPASFGGTT